MAKQKSLYVCSACGYECAKWNGRCPDCGEWNTFEEKEVTVRKVASGKNSVSTVSSYNDSDILARNGCVAASLVRGAVCFEPQHVQYKKA